MSLRAEVLAAVREHPGNLSLTEIGVRERRFAELPDELYAMAEQMSPSGATLEAKLTTAKRILTEAMKLADAWPGDGPATRIAKTVKWAETGGSFVDEVISHYDAAPAELLKRLAAVLDEAEKALPAPKPGAAAKTGDFGGAKASESRPDVMLAALANEIRLSEDVDYGKAMSLAKQRDPELAKRYKDDLYGGPAPEQTSDRPDVELAERARARAETDGIDYGKAMSLELSENLALAARYHEGHLRGAAAEPTVKVKAPPGMRLVSERPDVQLAERIKARQERDGVDWSDAARLELAEDPALASRYADYQAGRTAIDEATYRAETIRAAHHGRFSLEKAFNAALAEDPQLRAGVDAYYVRT